MHEPLSRELARILREAPAASDVTMNYLLARTEGRGLYLLIILLCVPFLPLVSPPGLSTLLGGIVFLLSLSMAAGTRPRLPQFIGERRLPPDLRDQLANLLGEPAGPGTKTPPVNFKQRLLRWAVRFLRFIEKWSRPRRTRWMNWRLARSGNALLVGLLALLLALPLPSAPVFPTNGLPAYAIVVIAASMLEEDGVLIFLGYALALVTIVFFCSIAGMVVGVLHSVYQIVRGLFAP